MLLISTDRLELIVNANKLYKTGEGIFSKSTSLGVRTYKQPRWQAYKITGGSYGKLNINIPRLMNETILEVLKDGQIICEDKADKSLIDLLTKRFNPNKKYSNRAVQIFNNLNTLANKPSYKSSKKENLVGSSIFTNGDEMTKRLTLLTGSRKAGNTNIRIISEIWRIIDVLLKLGHITKQEYDQYVQKYLI